jgi:hypothetical protein
MWSRNQCPNARRDSAAVLGILAGDAPSVRGSRLVYEAPPDYDLTDASNAPYSRPHKGCGRLASRAAFSADRTMGRNPARRFFSTDLAAVTVTQVVPRWEVAADTRSVEDRVGC